MYSTQPHEHHARQTQEPADPWIVDPLKNACDFIMALVLLVLAAPFIIVAALLVKLTSRGPAFHAQLRVGQGRCLFRIYKLRTLKYAGENATYLEGTVGLTPVGRFLRATYWDELPQLWNVLKGEMSMVGPAPERPEFVTPLKMIFPYYKERFLLKPGLTGLAQVRSGNEQDLVGARNKLALDLSYLELRSIGLDARILLASCLQILGLGITGWCTGMCRLPTKEAAILIYVMRILKETKPLGRNWSDFFLRDGTQRGWA